MNHQVKDHSDIRRSASEGAGALQLHVARVLDIGTSSQEGRIESLDMTDLGNAIVLLRDMDDVVAFAS